MATHRTFGEDLKFLQDHVETIVLSEAPDQKAVLVPTWQGRTMTSTAQGLNGSSFGWVNYEKIATGEIDSQINLFGGEDRLWIGPEGSQFSFFFEPGAEMTFEQWRTPPELDTEPFELIEADQRSATFQKRIQLTNYADFTFDMQLDRRVEMRSTDSTASCLGIDDWPAGVRSVCHESHNTLTNIGSQTWHPETGLPAIWMLGMNKPSDSATVVIPFQPGSEDAKGPVVTSDYFGELDEKRLKIVPADRLIFFRGDGRYRSKLGLSFKRALSWLAAWDPENGALTLVQFNLPEDPGVGYSNNLWKVVDDPYAGDVINSYNDGPNESGGLMGPFYELETLSPALDLASGKHYTHIHRTIHLQGDRSGIDRIARQALGTDLDTIESAF